jgi:hypothetical protein
MWNNHYIIKNLLVFSNLNGLARYFARVMPMGIIQDEVRTATMSFRHRSHSGIDQTQLEFVKMCESRLVRKARELQLEI